MTILNKLTQFRPVMILFILLTAVFLAGSSWLKKWDADRDVLILGNLVLFAASFVSFSVALRGLDAKNPHAFVRSVYSSIMLKFFIAVIAALIYIASYKKEINKPALFTCMALYLLYTLLEVSVLTKILKKRSDAKKASTY
jgi:hypothetical protein